MRQNEKNKRLMLAFIATCYNVATSILSMLSLSAWPEMPANPSLTGFAKSLPAAPHRRQVPKDPSHDRNVNQKFRENCWKVENCCAASIERRYEQRNIHL